MHAFHCNTRRHLIDVASELCRFDMVGSRFVTSSAVTMWEFATPSVTGKGIGKEMLLKIKPKAPGVATAQVPVSVSLGGSVPPAVQGDPSSPLHTALVPLAEV